MKRSVFGDGRKWRVTTSGELGGGRRDLEVGGGRPHGEEGDQWRSNVNLDRIGEAWSIGTLLEGVRICRYLKRQTLHIFYTFK